MSILSAVADAEGKVSDYARAYYQKDCDTGTYQFTGAAFELLSPDDNDPFNITAADLYAVSVLSVTVPAKAGVPLLTTFQPEIHALLKDITQRDLSTVVKAGDFEETLGPGQAAWRLWDLLCRNGKWPKWGIGPTTASKIMARKRPKLIPIEDKVVNSVVGMQRYGNSWELWREAWAAGPEQLERVAEEVRVAAKRPDLSSLRALDVVLWMSGKYGSGHPIVNGVARK